MRSVEWGYLLLVFDGRISRAQIWLGVLVLSTVTWAIVTAGRVADSAFIWSVGTAIGVLVVWSGLALSIKRWHDRDESGWWIFLNLVHFIGPVRTFLEHGFFPGTPGLHEFGTSPLT